MGIIKIIVSIIILVLIINIIDVEELKKLFLQISFLNILYFCLFFSIIVPLLAFRWFLIFYKENKDLKFIYFFKLTYESFFLNQFLPAPLSGDAYKYFVGRENNTIPKYLNSIIIDRIIGIYTLFTTLYILFFLFFETNFNNIYFMIVSLIVLNLFFFYLIRILCMKKINSYFPLFFQVFLIEFYEVLIQKKFKYVLIVSLFERFLIMFLFIKILNLLMPNESLFYLIRIIFFFNISLFFASIPISFGGWGIRESSLLYLGSLYGDNLEILFLSSAIFGLVLMIISIPGFFLLIQNKMWMKFLKKNKNNV